MDVRAGIVIGADGLRSRVAALAHAPVERAGHHATATVYGHFADLPVDDYHAFYREGVSAGAIPTDDGRTCLFVSMPLRRYLASFPAGLVRLHREVLAEATPTLHAALPAARLDRKLHAFPGHAERAA